MSENIKAVLVTLSIPIMPNCREDKDLTEEFRQKKHLGKKAGKWSKYLLPNHAFERMRKIGSTFRNQEHYKLTLPWEDGKQLLPAGAYERYTAATEQARAAFMEAKAEFGARYESSYRVPRQSSDAQEYFDLLESLGMPLPKIKGDEIEIPSLVDQAKIMHNGTFNPKLYLPWVNIEDRFGFTVTHDPVPKASHFIAAGIAADAMEEMREEIETRNEHRVNEAVKETWTRLMTPVQAIADKLTSKETIFRDTLIGNVREIVEIIPALNLTNDTELLRIAKEIEDKFANLDPDVLREDNTVRREATAAAKAIVSHFGKIGKRRFA